MEVEVKPRLSSVSENEEGEREEMSARTTPKKEVEAKESYSEEKFERSKSRRISQVVQLEQLSREVS